MRRLSFPLGQFLAAIVPLAFATALRAQSVLFLTDGDSSTLQAVNVTDGSTVYSVTTYSLAYPIAVRDSIWLGQRDDSSSVNGREFSLATGAATGATSTLAGTSLAGAQLLDGTTSGIANYTLGWTGSGSIQVYQAGLDWSNLTPLFSTASLGLGTEVAGIAFDTASGNLWLSGQTGIYQVTLAGALVSQFALGANERGSLAYQASTDTLWFVPNSSSSAIREYGKDGTLLQSLVVGGRSGNVWGAEFAAVPEPSTYALLAGGVAALAWLRRRRAA